MQSTAVIEVAETNAVQEKKIWTVVGPNIDSSGGNTDSRVEN